MLLMNLVVKAFWRRQHKREKGRERWSPESERENIAYRRPSYAKYSAPIYAFIHVKLFFKFSRFVFLNNHFFRIFIHLCVFLTLFSSSHARERKREREGAKAYLNYRHISTEILFYSILYN